MRKLYLFFIMVFLITLSGCDLLGNPNFHKVEGLEIESYQVYEYFDENDDHTCEPVTAPWRVAARTDDDVVMTLFSFQDCSYSFFVLNGNTFVSLTEAVEHGLFTLNDVLEASSIEFLETYDLKNQSIAYFTLQKPGGIVTVYDNQTDVARIVASSGNSSQRFVKLTESQQSGFSMTEELGEIIAYDTQGNVVAQMTVYEDLIYDNRNEGFLYSTNFELFYELTVN